MAGARPHSGNLKLYFCSGRRNETPYLKPGLSFFFPRTFSFFRPKERKTAVWVETDVSLRGQLVRCCTHFSRVCTLHTANYTLHTKTAARCPRTAVHLISLFLVCAHLDKFLHAGRHLRVVPCRAGKERDADQQQQREHHRRDTAASFHKNPSFLRWFLFYYTHPSARVVKKL